MVCRAWADIRCRWERSRRRRRSLAANKRPWFLWRFMSALLGLDSAPTPRAHMFARAGVILLLFSTAAFFSWCYSTPTAEEEVDFPIWQALRAEQ